MKRYCKDVDILDFEFLQFCAAECLRKKWKRRDVLEYFSGLTGRSKEEILYAIKSHQERRKARIGYRRRTPYAKAAQSTRT